MNAAEIMWATSQDQDAEYLEIVVNDGLGVLVVQEKKEDMPRLIFCSLFPDPEGVFHEGRNPQHAAISILELRELLCRIEASLARRPLP